MNFPNVDPIPIPAPVWLMKALGLLTLSLHFVAVQILIGSLVAVIWFSWRGQTTQSAAYKSAANVVARRLTIVMTYVINLGIPPLLFAQVLYGRALYTSSDLIAAIWIAVIPILMLAYWLMYRVVNRTAAGKPAALIALITLILAAGVGRILTLNMSLMLRPEVWKAMYAHTATGLQLPPADPTGIPRWAFMMLGALMTSGLWILLNSSICTIEDDTKAVLRRFGAGMTIVGGVAAAVMGFVVFSSQPQVVQSGLAHTPYYQVSALIWIAGAVIAVVLALTQIGRAAISVPVTLVGCLGAFLSICGAVMVRDGIRDLTLKAVGFNVWARHEVANWWVLGLFFLLFVVTLAVIGWLLLVMKNAKPLTEQVA